MQPRYRLPTKATALLATTAVLATPTAATAQETLFISCKPLTFWQGDEDQSGFAGRQFIVRATTKAIDHWQAETRTWENIQTCPPNKMAYELIQRNGWQIKCQVVFEEGQFFQSATWADDGRGWSRFTVSRVTGAYTYESAHLDVGFAWREKGVCSPADNPETQATERVF